MGLCFFQDTICAIATPTGDGGIGIIKISGRDSLPIVQRLFRPSRPQAVLRSHRLYHGTLCNPATEQPIDEVLVSYMAAPRSYTREDVVEINCHSGYAVLHQILVLVLGAGARLAEPGEFTRRAFCNGRIDLSQAEAVAEIIHSRSQLQLELAARHLGGALRRQIESWRDTLLQVHAEIEVQIDFSDDLDTATLDAPSLLDRLRTEIVGPLQAAIHSFESGRTIREGLSIALIGKPNAGKSSILNALLGRERAIVTAIPGTTRDVIEDRMTLAGIQIRVLDTAGIRAPSDEIESLGIEWSRRSTEEADLVVWVLDRGEILTPEDDTVREMLSSRRHVLILNKSDLPPKISQHDIADRYGSVAPFLEMSALCPVHADRLRDFLTGHLVSEPLLHRHSLVISNIRHKECLEQALASVVEACNLLSGIGDLELASMEILAARRQVELVLGLHCDEELLDRIFSRFCIGK